MRTHLDDATIRSYLLGLIAETDAESLEEAFLADPELWERVRGVEDDLLDDYAAERLRGDERAAFERRYLATAPLRERVLAARALRLADRGAREAATAAAMRPRGRWAALLALAATLLVALILFWRWPGEPRRVTDASPSPVPSLSPSPIAPAPSGEPPAPPAASPPPVTHEMVLALAPVLLRGEAPPRELRTGARSDVVRLELEGDAALLPAPPARLEVAIESVEGQQVWRGAATRERVSRRPSLLASATVPLPVLPPGDYLVTLAAVGEPDGVVHRYYFRARR